MPLNLASAVVVALTLSAAPKAPDDPHPSIKGKWELVVCMADGVPEIARGVFDDLSEVDIASAPGISRHTVHTHVERLYRKAEVTSRTQLIVRVFLTFLTLRADTVFSNLGANAPSAIDRCPGHR